MSSQKQRQETAANASVSLEQLMDRIERLEQGQDHNIQLVLDDIREFVKLTQWQTSWIAVTILLLSAPMFACVVKYFG